jgi:membrane protein DedA with SNARE-associated domain/rhodanese-related sulfurtransferase
MRAPIAHLPEITYPIVFLAVLASQLCVPVPAILFLAAAGTLAALGKMNLLIIITGATVGCLIGDFAWFLVGRRMGTRALRVFGLFSSDRRSLVKNTRTAFNRWGAYLFLIAKFVPGLDGLLPPLAGTQQQRLLAFLLFDAAGSALWSAFYSGTGYLFADRIEAVAEALGHLTTFLAWAIVAPLVAYLGWRFIRLVRMMQQLRMRSISPSQLYAKLQKPAKLAILDLNLFDSDEEATDWIGIPGAVCIDPARLRSTQVVSTLPADLQIILYSSSGSELTTAHAALSLQARGVAKVWILRGGLKSWREMGLPVSTQVVEVPDLVARYGISVTERTGRLTRFHRALRPPIRHSKSR